ncbi:MAG: multiple resistance and pH regulation protein F [Candidatus Neomarinimicrobiota bacterium]|nr:multiple resistance and pH regulation protein F [Candidatus Neomarinimicrobiota bacterium]RKY48080.1 MAG: multiple resistance and pH regulation protein F [Candidatus Neomarinimicrobiota bacterium]
MKYLRWFLGLIFVGCFLYFNFFVYQGDIIFKLINVILFSTLFVLFRVIFGPSPADRIVAVDILGILIIGMLALIGLYYDKSFFMDIGLIWALLSFIASLAFAKILEGRQLDD